MMKFIYINLTRVEKPIQKIYYCKNFKGIDSDILENLVNIHKNWELVTNEEETIVDFINLNLPNEFVRLMSVIIKFILKIR